MRFFKPVIEKILITETCRHCGAFITYDLLDNWNFACGVCGAKVGNKVELSIEYVQALQVFIERARSS